MIGSFCKCTAFLRNDNTIMPSCECNDHLRFKFKDYINKLIVFGKEETISCLTLCFNYIEFFLWITELSSVLRTYFLSMEASIYLNLVPFRQTLVVVLCFGT